jgi:hypothetical protein
MSNRRKHVINSGDKFSRLTAVERLPNRRGKEYWRCLCECGNTSDVVIHQLVYGKTRSCGCLKRELRGENHQGWKGYGGMCGGYLALIRCRCRYHKKEFSLTAKHLWELFLSQDGRCALTGLPLNLQTMDERSKGVDQNASLDRIDSAKGYVPGNVRWVHKTANYMKQEYSDEEFFRFCEMIVDKRRGEGRRTSAPPDYYPC